MWMSSYVHRLFVLNLNNNNKCFFICISLIMMMIMLLFCMYIWLCMAVIFWGDFMNNVFSYFVCDRWSFKRMYLRVYYMTFATLLWRLCTWLWINVVEFAWRKFWFQILISIVFFEWFGEFLAFNFIDYGYSTYRIYIL